MKLNDVCINSLNSTRNFPNKKTEYYLEKNESLENTCLLTKLLKIFYRKSNYRTISQTNVNKGRREHSSKTFQRNDKKIFKENQIKVKRILSKLFFLGNL